MKWISELKNEKGTKNALIIGSGASLDYLPYLNIVELFRKNAYIITVNDMCYDENLYFDFCINHHTVKDLPDWYIPKMQKAVYETPGKFIFPEHDCNDPQRGTTNFEGNYWKYKGLPVCETTSVFVEPIIHKEKDRIFVGGSILFDAIGLGIHLGIENFYLMGFDGGKYEGNAYCRKYREIWPEDEFFVTGHSIRTMNSFKALQEWLRPRGVFFTHLSARYGSSDLQPSEWDTWEYRILCPG